FYAGHFEWLRMSITGALRAPLSCLGIADEVFDFLEGFLNIRIELWSGCNDTALTEAVSGKNPKQGLHVQVLAPLSEFKQSKTIGRPVTPGAGMAGTPFERANRLLPVEPLIETIALKIISAREPKELRFHRGKLLHDINAVSILAIL